MQHLKKNTKYRKESLRDLAKTEYKQDLQTDLEAFLTPLSNNNIGFQFTKNFSNRFEMLLSS